MGFLEILTLIFVVLKLTEVIDWSWWVVLSPMWGAVLVYILLFGGLLLTMRRKVRR